jgi:colanic acid/amylovoran biosynthesis glycosyltransferase
MKSSIENRVPKRSHKSDHLPVKPSSLKVWIITMAFPHPSETFACNDVLALRRAGVKVEVHGLRPPHYLFPKLITEQGVSKIRITHNSIRKSLEGLWVGLTHPLLLMNFTLWILKHAWKRPLNLFKSLILIPRSLQLFDTIQREKPDIIYLYWSHFPSLVGHLVQSRLPQVGVAISFVAHDVYYPEFDSKDSYTRSVARHADVVQTITMANIPNIERYGIPKENILLCYHGVDFNKIPLKKKKIKRRIVTAGRLIPEKGFEDVLVAFSQVLKLWPDASLVVLGDGPERQRLENLADSLAISHAVQFRGFVPHSEIFDEMAVAEVFLFMSQAERLPNVVKEAIACHCLCVVSHTPGIEELIQDQTHGYIIQQRDRDRATTAIHQVFSHPEKMVTMTELASQSLKAKFDLDIIIKKMMQNWQTALAQKTLQETR